jgi:hypothetical protein
MDQTRKSRRELQHPAGRIGVAKHGRPASRAAAIHLSMTARIASTRSFWRARNAAATSPGRKARRAAAILAAKYPLTAASSAEKSTATAPPSPAGPARSHPPAARTDRSWSCPKGQARDPGGRSSALRPGCRSASSPPCIACNGWPQSRRASSITDGDLVVGASWWFSARG